MDTAAHAMNSKPSGKISRVLVLNTGGTIGMVVDPEHPEHGLIPAKNRFLEVCQSHPSLNDEKLRMRLLKEGKLPDKFLILPGLLDGGERFVAYHLEEHSELVDSSNMTVKHWQKLCRDIRDNYVRYDGFVILHGTDTMAYTASALSFMLVNLNKTVILTGSQKPIFENRTDGLRNLVSSLLIAGLHVVPEVSIFSFDRLLRGNRCIKRSSDEFFCFDSCNVPPLMTLGVKVHMNDCLMMPKNKKKFYAHIGMNDNVSLLRFFPGISSRAINAALGEPYQGIVLHTFGSGNVPSNRKDLIEAIKAAIHRGAIVVNCTQCPYGPVAGIYETGTILTRIGVLSGNDMTVEAALTKLMFVLSMNSTLADKKKVMALAIRGEMIVTDIGNKRESLSPKTNVEPKAKDGIKTPSGNNSSNKAAVGSRSYFKCGPRTKRSSLDGSSLKKPTFSDSDVKSSNEFEAKGVPSFKDNNKAVIEAEGMTNNNDSESGQPSARKSD